MKTILDKINPKYIECTAGICEHITHKTNVIVWSLLAIAVITLITKYRHGIITRRS